MKKYFYLIILSLVLVSCASSEQGLKMATAQQIQNTTSDDVNVSDINRGATFVKWNANSKGQNYKCESDDMVRKTNCTKI